MLEGDVKCLKCGKTIYSYSKRKVDFDNWKWRCPHCKAWHDLEEPKFTLEGIQNEKY